MDLCSLVFDGEISEVAGESGCGLVGRVVCDSLVYPPSSLEQSGECISGLYTDIQTINHNIIQAC